MCSEPAAECSPPSKSGGGQAAPRGPCGAALPRAVVASDTGFDDRLLVGADPELSENPALRLRAPVTCCHGTGISDPWDLVGTSWTGGAAVGPRGQVERRGTSWGPRGQVERPGDLVDR